MSTYQTSAPLSVDPDQSLLFAIMTLTSNGFAIDQQSKNNASLLGPGMNNTRQNPLLGASRVEVGIVGKQLQIQAELGALDRMKRFVTWFPLLLPLFLACVFVVLGFTMGQPFAGAFGANNGGFTWVLIVIGICLLPGLPWLVLSPMMSRWMEKRTKQALDTLVNNAVKALKLND